MFIDFFFLLKNQGIKIGLTEWLSLNEALLRGHGDDSLSKFYYLCRALCIKHEKHFDLYDQCFAHHFKGTELSQKLDDSVWEWLQNAKLPRKLSDEEMRAMESLNLDELKKMFEERLKEQNERHDGGNKWVGTGGTSPFGHGGYHPSGVRVGGEGRHRSAMQIASKRMFANLRNDKVLDTRQFGLALKKLKRLNRVGLTEELDLDETISKTAKNGGDIEMVFKAEQVNSVKLLLFMDVGGSMTWHSKVCERLFSAAFQAKHFKSFEHLYFHNCPYEFVYTDIEMGKRVTTAEVFQKYDSSWTMIVVGDAAMSPYELMSPGGSVDYYHQNEKPGIYWLQEFKKRFPISAWLNPETEAHWGIQSNEMVRSVFPQMYTMSLEGLENAVEHLVRVSSK